MNEHLSERFSRSRHPQRSDRHQGADQAHVLILPPKLNLKVRTYFDNAPPGDDDDENEWTSRPEIPSAKELLGSHANGHHGHHSHHGSGSNSSATSSLPKRITPNNVPIGPFANKYDYLGVQYNLLREDTIRQICEYIAAVRDKPSALEAAFDGKIGIYEKVHICAFTFAPRGIATRVTFSLARTGKRILWEQSKRLISGSLVVLTPADDMFQKKLIPAIVAARPLSGLLLNPPEIDLFFAPQEMELDPSVEYVMIEDNGGLYEGTRHTLTALQHMMHEPFPLSEHLISAKKEVGIAHDVAKAPRTDMTSVFVHSEDQDFENFDITKPWPLDQITSELDPSQLNALKRILIKRLAIVQGPPGTGKTHVSVQAVKIWLANRKPGDPPIVLACQTNHAIDQLLRHISEFEPEFVRLGGRSKDPDIKKRTLFNVRQSISQNAPAGCMFGAAKKKLKDLEKEIGILLAPLQPGKMPLDHRMMEELKLLTKSQADSLEAGARSWVMDSKTTPAGQHSPWKVWLDDKLTAVPHKQKEEDLFGFDYEAVDLEFEQLKEMEAEAVTKDEDEIEALNGITLYIADNFTCRKTTGMDATAKDSLKQKDMWKIPEAKRGAVYRYLQRELKKLLRDALRIKAESYQAEAKKRQIGGWEKDEMILKEQSIIGMTTTGFSKYRPLIAALGVKIILIEEAAETLEAPVTVACIPSLQQLVLVGDHKQLRPHTHVKDHEDAPHFLNISLFERMANNGVEFSTLVKQRRMIPEVRRLLCPIYGSVIKDHPSVADKDNRPDVQGMGGVNSFFFTHGWVEQRDDQMSCINPAEADMIVKFVEYLVYQGIDTMSITVLCFYNGQRKKILSSLRSNVALNGRHFKVVTVDSYQGEENEILLLSLARSNQNGQMGFLNVENRICVALSRAQRGFYIFGNGKLLFQAEAKYTEKQKTWSDVIYIMSGKTGKPKEIPTIEPNRLGIELPLRCRNHGTVIRVSEPEHFDNLVGGCRIACGGTLPCGHHCTLTCHPFSHEDVNCEQCRETPKPIAHIPKLEPIAKVPKLDKRTAPGPESSPSRSSEASWNSFAGQESTRVEGLQKLYAQRGDTAEPSASDLLLDLSDAVSGNEEEAVSVGMGVLALDGAGDVDDGATVVHKGGRVKVKEMYGGAKGKNKVKQEKKKVVMGAEVTLLD
ncbi:unnamed protein product [Zymoseptoria tritici ST99CH_3D7]|uniref:Helicase ATP-binding domain-containing protein n=1 Tax=Zymoseptoria tritici (strain ST99CH_3D7) TaxID=1276538 RepID=A0A1X7RPR5_ZYMT9|nr:unnamed protein product [Zymoseptoria tritici ST99CH_3D7]